MAVYYNEFDPDAAQWLCNLIANGCIPDGEVDTRSIEDVQPEDLKGFTQHHFFAGIGGWPLALRLAGWPDDRPAWTGSPPCQPFSVAGKQLGADDPRHLWPHFFRLLRACRPPVLFGEQVSAAIGKHWLDGVFADLEGEGYACRAFSVPACSVNAPHRRDRLWLVAERGGAVGDRERARDWKDTPGMAATRPDGRSRIDQLPRQAATAMWPTPTSLAPAKNGNNPAGNSAGLVAIREHAMAQGRGVVPDGSSATTAKPGALNPAFVCWLMGFPLGWLEAVPAPKRRAAKSRSKGSAMPSSRKSRSSLSSPTSNGSDSEVESLIG